jgi:hypothetical protein
VKTRTFASTLLASLLASTPLAGGEVSVGRFTPGETLAPFAVASPASDSRTFVRTAALDGDRAVFDLPATGTGTLLVWVLPAGERDAALRAGEGAAGRELETRLTTPAGRVLGPDADGGRSDTVRRFRIEEFGSEELGLAVGARQEALRVLAPEPGLHRLELSAPGAAAVTVAVAELDSPIVLTTWASPLSRQPGEPVTLNARLLDGGAPVAGVVSARLAARDGAVGEASEAVALFDDGLHGDGAAGDGHFAATLERLDLPAGPVDVRVEAEGRDGRGSAFARTGATGFVSERGSARLLPGSVRSEWVGEGEARVLRVTATAAVREGGDYRLDVLAAGAPLPDGARPGLAWAERTDDLRAGHEEIVVDVPAALLGEGPVHLDVRLLGLSRPGVAGRATLDVAR